MLRWMRALLPLMMCLLAAQSWAGVPETPRFRMTGVPEGLPSSYVVALARDHDGYLWAATADGLARFDGVGFRIWRNVPDDPGSLPGNIGQALYIDARDRIWVSTESTGLSMLDAGRRRFRHFRMSGHPQIGSDDVWAIAGHKGEIWFGTYGGGLHRLVETGNGAEVRITRFMPIDDDPRSLPAETVLTLAFDAQGTLWVGTVQGIARWTGRDFERIGLPGEHAAPMIYSLTADGDAVWAGTSVGIFRRDGDDHWVAPSWAPMFERPNAVMALARDRDGQFWIGSQRGLWRTRADGVPIPVHANGAGIAKPVQSLLLQDNGALWAPFPGIGLGYLRTDWRQLAQFSRANSALGNEIYRGVAPARAGGLWLASYPGAPERLAADGSVQSLPPTTVDTLGQAKLVAVAETPQGILWAGQRQGLFRIAADGGVREWTSQSEVDPTFSGLDLLRIAADGSLWLSFNGSGVQQRDADSGKVLRSLPAGSQGVGSADIEAMEFSVDSGPWIAGDGGVSRWNAQAEQFEPMPVMGAARVYAIAFDGPDSMWLSRLAGLEHFRRDKGRWLRGETAGTAQGIPAIEAAGMRIDRNHRIWLTTTRGLFRWDPATRHLRRFGLQDGLSSQEFESHSVTLTDAGVLAATTADGGVVLVDTTAPDPAPVQPDLRIAQVAVRREGRWRAQSLDDIVLSPQERELRVRTRLLAYEDPQANRYSSWLEDYDRDWVVQDDNGDRIFSGLQPGGYVLHLRATDAAGNRSAEQVLRWRVLPPWWRTPWAMLGFAALVVLLSWWAAAAYRARLKQRHALQLVEHKRELAEQASVAKTRFLATLGHEVRTPMTGVLGMSELLLHTSLDGRQHGYVESIRRAGNHLLQLVNDALDLARIEAGKLELVVQPFDPRELVDEVVDLLSPLAAQRGLRFSSTVFEAVPSALLGDRMRIEQILLNLLGNALKFTEHGEVVLQVGTLAPQGVRLEVVDTGPGLSEEQLTRIFQRFEQADGARTAARHGGSGLGLAISRELASAMGGRIDVDSTPGQGTRFSVELPLPAAAVLPNDAAPAGRFTPVDRPQSLRLLLVEDDATVAEVITGLFRAQGHEVVHVGNGLAALVEITGDRFDAGLLDLDLPGMDGLALARQLRAQGFDAPLVAVTARADAEAEPAARAAGFDRFLRKPVTGAMLAEAIKARVAPAR